MNEKREDAAGVMFKTKLHVFGGWDGKIRSNTTELISIDGVVEEGPELPEALRQHAITSVNSTISILSGGRTSDTHYSPLTWYFNHDTSVFSPGPSLLEGRRSHGSATIVDKETTAKIPVVTGGQHSDHVKLDSTEMLINGHWQPGTIQCPKRQLYFERALVFFHSFSHYTETNSLHSKQARSHQESKKLF